METNDNQTSGNINFSKRTCLTCGKTDEAMDECEKCNPKGMLGWICPVCGRGNSPFSSLCPCKSFPTYPITCGMPDLNNPNPTINSQQ